MYVEIVNRDNLNASIGKVLLGPGKYKIAAFEFCQHRSLNLNILYEELESEVYVPSEYVNFTVFEPKERSIHAPAFRDKIVQHMVYNVIAPHYRRRFIHDSYSCIVDKGNDRAVARLLQFSRTNLQLHGEAGRVVKTDVVNFFGSIKRHILKAIVAKTIKCERTLRLLYIIIDTSPEDVGIPLGNLTNQVLSNVYMNELDHYAKRVLKLKYYVRYADDIFVFVESHERGREVLRDIKTFLNEKLELDIHKYKSQVSNPKYGLDALGFKIYPTHIKLKGVSKRTLRSRVKNIPFLLSVGYPPKRIEQSINGWMGHTKRAKRELFLRCILDDFDYVKMVDGQFVIKKSLIKQYFILENPGLINNGFKVNPAVFP